MVIMECEQNNEDLVERGKEKVLFGEQLVAMVASKYTGIPGASKILNSLQKEVKFLKKIIDAETIKHNHVTSSNLIHYDFLLKTLQNQSGVIHIDCLFPLQSRKLPLRVDIVADNGMKWIKVIARNPKSVLDAAKGNLNFGTRNILDQAQDYLMASKTNLCLFQKPRVIFYFSQQVENSLREELHDLGVETRTLDGPYDDDKIISPTVTETLNLDVTTMLAWISSVTNGNANFRFVEDLLTEQARKECLKPLKPILDKLFEGKRLICCQTAYNSFERIVGQLAGPKELIRAKELMQRVEILPDIVDVPKGLSDVQFTSKINDRSLKIFSFGIEMLAMTVTANKAFIRSTKMKGVNVPAFIHESRALTEKKEASATKVM